MTDTRKGCVQCGTSLPSHARFCASCGTAQFGDSPEQTARIGASAPVSAATAPEGTRSRSVLTIIGLVTLAVAILGGVGWGALRGFSGQVANLGSRTFVVEHTARGLGDVYMVDPGDPLRTGELIATDVEIGGVFSRAAGNSHFSHGPFDMRHTEGVLASYRDFGQDGWKLGLFSEDGVVPVLSRADGPHEVVSTEWGVFVYSYRGSRCEIHHLDGLSVTRLAEGDQCWAWSDQHVVVFDEVYDSARASVTVVDIRTKDSLLLGARGAQQGFGGGLFWAGHDSPSQIALETSRGDVAVYSLADGALIDEWAIRSREQIRVLRSDYAIVERSEGSRRVLVSISSDGETPLWEGPASPNVHFSRFHDRILVHQQAGTDSVEILDARTGRQVVAPMEVAAAGRWFNRESVAALTSGGQLIIIDDDGSVRNVHRFDALPARTGVLVERPLSHDLLFVGVEGVPDSFGLLHFGERSFVPFPEDFEPLAASSDERYAVGSVDVGRVDALFLIDRSARRSIEIDDADSFSDVQIYDGYVYYTARFGSEIEARRVDLSQPRALPEVLYQNATVHVPDPVPAQ